MKSASSKIWIFLMGLMAISCVSNRVIVYNHDFSRKDRVIGEVKRTGVSCIEYNKKKGKSVSYVERCGDFYLVYKGKPKSIE